MVADAPPVIVCAAASVCLISITVESLPPTAICDAKLVPPSARVNVPADTDVLVTMIDVTTAVVNEGTVYSVVPVEVVAAPRKSAFEIVGISCNFPLVDIHYVCNCRTL